MKTVLDTLKGRLVVSCQALENEPLHSPFIMSRMALAARQGGAAAIRANSVVDIEAIKEQVTLPVIGIIKREYPDSEVFITATMKEVDELMTVSPAIIALDATDRARPGGNLWQCWLRAFVPVIPRCCLWLI
ncbi:N-acylglucosamine-6-phosphate 2-epimerase [Enterobacter cloacae]|uniref:N-acylglucosamine-6-phosphate 2-epimerase n=1 Tax=Enterobacter cloacae TaxID=550 RepID=A0A377LUV8_ENTCL|nr:N-acylglucosamine-6-phosphate 2-epimerase [Enterobacter cloacae]